MTSTKKTWSTASRLRIGMGHCITCVVSDLNDCGDLDAAGLVRVGGRLLLHLDEGSGEEQDVGNDVTRDHVAVDQLAVQGLEKDHTTSRLFPGDIVHKAKH